MKDASDPQAILFEDALAQTAKNVRHLLIGNGFSIAARPSFTYRSLARAARLSEPLRALFAQTDDFELVLLGLRDRIADPMITAADLSTMKEQEEEVREGFVDALQTVHPEHSMKMGEVECDRCATFLEEFVGRSRTLKLAGRVYTTNYDLLLYWVVARSGRRLWCYDSHFNDDPDPHKRKLYGIWKPDSGPMRARPPELVYLHGALHTYDAANGAQGMLRSGRRKNLIDQSRARLAKGNFPVIVAEGTSEAKASRISRSKYLTWATGWLAKGMRHPNAVLFTHGHSLDLRDAHLLKHVGNGRISAVYVGAWGGLEGDQAAAIRNWNSCWQGVRPQQHPLRVYVYDTSLVSPWKYPLKGER